MNSFVMKNILSFITSAFLILFVVSCQNEDSLSMVGYVRLGIGISTSTIDSRAYNPEQWAVKIINAKGETVKETQNLETDKDFQGDIALSVGTYTIQVSSAGFDNNSGFDKPYYKGSSQVTIEANKSVTAEVTCKLANVKVSVVFDQSFKDVFKTATVTVGAISDSGIDNLSFDMNDENVEDKFAYFPVTDLQAILDVTNMKGEQHTHTESMTDVKAQQHYILKYVVGDIGSGDVDVSIDHTSHIYTYTFNISTTPKTSLVVDQANAWSSFAFLSGAATTKEGETLDPSQMAFEYRLKDTEQWTKVIANNVSSENIYTAKIINLTPNQEYEYRMIYGDEEYKSDPVSFSTENCIALPNGSLDEWYQAGKTWYPVSESDYTINGSWWDSSNPGTTTGAGALVNVNPTQGNSDIVHTQGGKSAELKSQYASALGIGKFAAASLYSGKFNELVNTKGAKLDFGQPFTSRPTKLHGWFQYSTGAMDYVGENTPSDAGIVKDETIDLCSIYIALSTTTYVIDNTDPSTFIDFEGDSQIIAYGELPATEAVDTKGEWKEFNIDLKYKSLDKKPTHIIIVCSASKYGDYFTGSTKSVMYLDDMELIYGDDPVEWQINK
jgi:hypothetical protein